jgi:hypothetical protein
MREAAASKQAAMKATRLVALGFAFALAGASAVLAAQPSAARLDPFLHLYREYPDGGAAVVLAHNATAGLVRSVRSGLRKEASRYARGEYPDPAGNGKTPAVAKLRAGAARIGVSYGDIKGGGAIRFTTKDPSLVNALYAWFAATVAANRKKSPAGGPGFGD